MKRTIKEVYDLIVKKRDNAVAHLLRVDNNLLENQIYGSIQAYQDVLTLITSSHLLEK